MSDYLAVYGTLRPGGGALQSLGIAERMRWVGPCLLRGALYDLGEYPALLPGDNEVKADLFHAPDAETLAILDEWEEYTEGDNASLYLRKETALLSPALSAQIYWYNRSPMNAPKIDSGCWLSWQAQKNG